MKSLTLILLVAVCWLAGLLAFSGRVLRSTPAPQPPRADGIVVLTGGSSLRLVEAMRLLEKGEARRLLVSGVNPEASRTDRVGPFPAGPIRKIAVSPSDMDTTGKPRSASSLSWCSPIFAPSR